METKKGNYHLLWRDWVLTIKGNSGIILFEIVGKLQAAEGTERSGGIGTEVLDALTKRRKKRFSKNMRINTYLKYRFCFTYKIQLIRFVDYLSTIRVNHWK